MKKVIISKKQLFEGIMDSQKTRVGFTGANAAEMGANAAEKFNDALRTGIKPDAIQLNGKSANNNADDANETVIGINGNEPNIQKAVTNSIENAVNNGADINKLNVQANAEDVTNPTMSEGKRYTKGELEEQRLANMKKYGKTYTKDELEESFRK